MALRVGRDRDLEIADALEARDQLGRGLVAVGVGLVGRAGPGVRVTAQRHDVAHARLPIVLGDGVDLGPARRDAGEVRGGTDRRLVDDALQHRVGALAGVAAGAVSHRDEMRVERRQPLTDSHSVASISGVDGGKNSNETLKRGRDPRLRRCVATDCIRRFPRATAEAGRFACGDPDPSKARR